ncbi:MAG: Nif11-like leader peptide family natural product precursor [Atopobiaceae bacterium]|nr:Nif11-like leader peptide family natural product precursor [Atopobiaceae bacterium]
MDLESLSPELLEKAKACKTAEELTALAKEAGLELSEEELSSIAGGLLLEDLTCFRYDSTVICIRDSSSDPGTCPQALA